MIIVRINGASRRRSRQARNRFVVEVGMHGYGSTVCPTDLEGLATELNAFDKVAIPDKRRADYFVWWLDTLPGVSKEYKPYRVKYVQ
jgi:hypothetical protein